MMTVKQRKVKGSNGHNKQRSLVTQVRSGPVTSFDGDNESAGDSYDDEVMLYRWLAVLVVASVAGFLHFDMNWKMWQNQSRFSHLSNQEREMFLYSELGFYYSFYKNIIDAPSFVSGLTSLVQNDLAEYPNSINALNRFNLYPEIVLGWLYRTYKRYAETFGINTMVCYTVTRPEPMTPVQSCEGLGEPMFFYVHMVFILTGVMLASFVILAFLVSGGSVWAGILAASWYLYNHSECTRVQWTPVLRESFSFPLLVLHQLSLVIFFKTGIRSISCLFVVFTAVIFMLPWQFAQFALLMEASAVYIAFLMGFLSFRRTQLIVLSLLCALGITFFLNFGNSMLLSSFYFSALLVIIIMLRANVITSRFVPHFPHLIISFVTYVAGTIAMKLLVAFCLNATEDAHIMDILRSKLSSYVTFDTLLYTCAKEFDFYDINSLIPLSKTLVVPCALLGIALVVVPLFMFLFKKQKLVVDKSAPESSDFGSKVGALDASIVYVLALFGAFTIMAGLIMRLKLFFTPQLILVGTLVAHRKLRPSFISGYTRYGLLFLLLAGTSFYGMTSYNNELQRVGEYNDFETEELMEFIKHKTPVNESYAGLMTTMSTILLLNKRPIINHPHYEDATVRWKTKLVYSMYSRVSLVDWYRNMKQLHAHRVVLSKGYCRTGPCTMESNFARLGQDQSLPILCDKFMHHPTDQRPYLKLEFENSKYIMFKLGDV